MKGCSPGCGERAGDGKGGGHRPGKPEWVCSWYPAVNALGPCLVLCVLSLLGFRVAFGGVGE